MKYPHFMEEQRKDQQLQQLLQDNSTSLKLSRISVLNRDLEVVCDTSAGRVRPFLPETLRRTVRIREAILSSRCGILNTKDTAER